MSPAAEEVAGDLRDHTAPEYIDGRPSASAHDTLLMKAADLIESQAAEIARLNELIRAHNKDCTTSCGEGDQEGVRCKYRPYFPRHCPECPRDWMIDTAALAQLGARE